jgi:hypothetical protein
MRSSCFASGYRLNRHSRTCEQFPLRGGHSQLPPAPTRHTPFRARSHLGAFPLQIPSHLGPFPVRSVPTYAESCQNCVEGERSAPTRRSGRPRDCARSCGAHSRVLTGTHGDSRVLTGTHGDSRGLRRAQANRMRSEPRGRADGASQRVRRRMFALPRCALRAALLRCAMRCALGERLSLPAVATSTGGLNRCRRSDDSARRAAWTVRSQRKVTPPMFTCGRRRAAQASRVACNGGTCKGTSARTPALARAGRPSQAVRVLAGYSWVLTGTRTSGWRVRRSSHQLSLPAQVVVFACRR